MLFTTIPALVGGIAVTQLTGSGVAVTQYMVVWLHLPPHTRHLSHTIIHKYFAKDALLCNHTLLLPTIPWASEHE